MEKHTLSDNIPHAVRESLAPIIDEYNSGGTSARTAELNDIRLMMDGGPDVFNNDSFFPMPDGYDPASWMQLRSRLMVLVNLVKASVRKVRSRVYGGDQRRIIHRNPYRAEIEQFIDGWYKPDMRAWFTNRVAYSNAPCVVLGEMRGGKRTLSRWLPDPCYTYLSVDPSTQRDYSAVAEFSHDGKVMQFVTREATGLIYANQKPVIIRDPREILPKTSYIINTDFGFFPGVVAHSEERRNRRYPYSPPAMRDAVKFSIRGTDILFNGSMLQKLQTKGIMVISGALEQASTTDLAEMMRQGVIFIDENGKAQFLIPQSNIGDTLDLLDRLIEVFSVVYAIPVDDLNPTSSKGTSAEEAQRRAEPHLSMTREMADVAMLDEKELIVRATGVLQWLEHGGPVDLDALREEVETEISLQPPLKPLSSPGDAQVAILGAERGAILPIDEARAWNPDAPERKLKEAEANIKAMRSEALSKLEPMEKLNERKPNGETVVAD